MLPGNTDPTGGHQRDTTSEEGADCSSWIQTVDQVILATAVIASTEME